MAAHLKIAPSRPPPPRVTPRASNRTMRSVSPPSTLFEPSILSYKDLLKVHDTAYRYIAAGLQKDETNQVNQAIESYALGLELLNKALRTNVETLSRSSREQIDKAKDIQMKMNKTKQEITFRLQTLQQNAVPAYTHSHQILMASGAPPSYEEALSENNNPPSYEDNELAALGESLMRRELSTTRLSNAISLYHIPDGVQLFYISPEGFVSAPSYPTALHILRLEDVPHTQGPNGESAPCFMHPHLACIQVGDWMYPLIPGTSPALHTSYGAYIFPDTMAASGSAVGLLLPDNLPAEESRKFEDLLRSLTMLEEQTPEQLTDQMHDMAPDDAADVVSKGILNAANFLAWGMEKGAEKASHLLKMGSEKIRENTIKCTQSHTIDPNIQKGFYYARQATEGAVKVTGYIVNKLGEATVHLAKELAPHIRKQGAKILPKSLTSDGQEGRSTLDGAIHIAATSMKGFGTVYTGLESAARSLGRSLVSETVEIVHHKFGEQAAGVTENTLYAAGNVAMATHYINTLGVKALAKSAARETGKAMIENLSQNLPSGSVPGDDDYDEDGRRKKEKDSEL
ncbi:unnamed protein product [Lymnaea stagnalis]|uniref:Senescence domain-containing protein n=1 Tax=Lymnaea stagnalis TaxID=6523 RepID=A0AAV2I0F3_LYMST